MTQWLIRTFIKSPDDLTSSIVRERYGALAGTVGIASNLLLFAAKLLAGLLSGSISIAADAVNNLSDSAASLITLVGFKLAVRPADEDHPYGHARYEYISGLLIACIILVIGFQFLVSSFRKVLAPSPVTYSPVFWCILVASMLLKAWQGRFNAKVGRIIGSPALAATAADSRNDVLTTGAILASAVLSRLTGLQVDGVMGVLVALFILYAGVGLIRQILSPLLGEAPERALVEEIQRKILGYASVIGLHDLMVHNYGPNRRFASVHVEFPAEQDIMVSHDIIDAIERDFATHLGISLVIHLDPVITSDPRLDELKTWVQQVASGIAPELSVHDFRMVEGVSHKNLIFDVLVPPRCKLSNKALREQITQEVGRVDGAYFCVITIDRSCISSVQENEKETQADAPEA